MDSNDSYCPSNKVQAGHGQDAGEHQKKLPMQGQVIFKDKMPIYTMEKDEED